MQIFQFPSFIPRVLAEAEAELPLWKELWNYFRDNYFTVDLTGRYEHIDVGSGSLLTIRNIILGLFAGIIIAAFAVAFDKNHLGRVVRKVIKEGCLSPETAKTLQELDCHRSPAVRGSIKRGTVLGKVLHCVEKEQHARDIEQARAAYAEKNGSEAGFEPVPFRMDLETAHFYIPDEEHYAAEVRFEKGLASGWRTLIAVVILSVVGAALLCVFLPDVLQMVDNMIGILAE